MAKQFRDLGPFSDLAALAIKANGVWPAVKPGAAASRRFLEALHFSPRAATPIGAKSGERWERDGVEGEAVSWSVGYGPRAQAWLFRPAGVKGKLPGVVVLHDHGGYKYFGKEKVADGPDGLVKQLPAFREEYYGGRAVANSLAKQGFAVLVHDVFMWGSRNFPLETMRVGNAGDLEFLAAAAEKKAAFPEAARYNIFAAAHENLMEKYAHVLGTTVAGIVNFEDRVAVNYLASRPDVNAGGVGCVGLSGGGMRSVLLQATGPVRAAVVVGAMSTYEGLLNGHVAKHTWMMFPWAFPAIGDWSDAAACRAPSPLMVQYAMKDPLFSVEGMRGAHRRIAATYRGAGKAGNYVGMEYPVTHRFDVAMQEDAFAFLGKHLG